MFTTPKIQYKLNEVTKLFNLLIATITAYIRHIRG